ncbi:HCP-like protein [Panus rudis PR-1116 ss-1]|nr:HCP-like protein [Panus rudis PR-1116 ss-1]
MSSPPRDGSQHSPPQASLAETESVGGLAYDDSARSLASESTRAPYHDAQDQLADDAPPPPPYQLMDAVEGMNALRIDDAPAHPPRSSSTRPQQMGSPHSDNQSLHHADRPAQTGQYAPAQDARSFRSWEGGDRTSAYSYDEGTSSNPPVGSDGYGMPRSGYPPGNGYVDPRWDSQQYAYGPAPAPHVVPPPSEYNNLYHAASSVLGMGPPPGAAAPQVVPPTQGYPTAGMLPQSYAVPANVPPQAAYAPYSQPVYGSAPALPSAPNAYLTSSPSMARGPPSIASSSHTDEREIEPRPPLQRSGTTASVTLRTQKIKAVDLSAPPYTKEYIDQYRQRIKDDPDPEAHFLYAKYLIDAAKKIGADAKDQRSVKKFRDALIAESLKVIRRLATQGQAYDEAQFFLANCHGTGMLGLPVDHERAYHLYLQAAKQNHPAACYRVAVCNEIGAGTRREPQRAAAFYRKAASLGDTAAMYKLGVILLRGALGEQPNPREAVGWLKRAAEQADEENPHALHELAMLYESPNANVVPYDPAYAKELYTRAGHLGYTHSQYKLGQCYEYGALTCPVDPRRSIAWYTKAAEKGHSEAELALSGWYLTGSEGVLKQSDSEAYLWARRAANKGLSKAEYAVGYYAEVGIGVKQDIEFAKRWYMRAAAQGNKRAMNRLTEMKRTGNRRMNQARPTRQDAKDECVIA